MIDPIQTTAVPAAEYQRLLAAQRSAESYIRTQRLQLKALRETASIAAQVNSIEVDALRVERDDAVSAATDAKRYLLSGADESTTTGKFWANEIRHAFGQNHESALVSMLHAELANTASLVESDPANCDPDYAGGLQHAIFIIRERMAALSESVTGELSL